MFIKLMLLINAIVSFIHKSKRKPLLFGRGFLKMMKANKLVFLNQTFKQIDKIRLNLFKTLICIDYKIGSSTEEISVTISQSLVKINLSIVKVITFVSGAVSRGGSFETLFNIYICVDIVIWKPVNSRSEHIE